MFELVDIISRTLFAEMTAILQQQGHIFSGNLVKSFEVKVEEKMTETNIMFLMENYGLSLNYGIPANRIPFSPIPPYRGGKSKYIEGLRRWAKVKFSASDKRALSIAFAIANKHIKEGYPLSKKIGFFDIAIKNTEKQIEAFIEAYIEKAIEEMIQKYIEDVWQ